ncbi:MAG TPA: VWA domain-containing protein [Vicinamibacterales bacterium]|nr:VWA domain-containing protein [Vicinamibacterales bacterium]
MAVFAGFGGVAIAVLNGAAVSSRAQVPAGSAGVTDRNSTPATAFSARAGETVSGTLAAHNGSRDSQFVAVSFDDSWKGKRFALVFRAAPNRTESLDVTYILADGSDGEIRQGTGEARMTHLSFPAGTQIFRVSAIAATDLPYTLTFEDVGPLPAGEEHEPNDVPALANDLPSDGTISGGADGASDFDSFRVHVTGPPSLFRITCECPHADWLLVLGGDGNALVQTYGFPDGKAELSNVLLAGGDHIIRVRNSSGRYTLHVVPTGPAPVEAGGAPPPIDAPVAAVDEVEPNGDRATAMPLALDSSRGGVTDFKNDVDMYRFTLLGRTPVHLTVESAAGAAQEIKLGWGSDDRQVARLSLQAGAPTPMTWDGTLAAGDYYVTISSGVPTSTPYRVRLRVGDPFAAGDAAPALAATSALQLDTSRVAASARDAQTIAGHLDLASTSEALDLTLATFVADERWTVTTDRPTVHLDRGGHVSVPVTVRVAPDAWDNHPVHVAIGARNASGAHVTATAVVVPDATVAVVNPTAAPALPAALAGGLNVAWSALGGESLDNHPLLIDGLSNVGGTQTMKLADAKNGVAIRLAGQGARVAGFVLVPAVSAAIGDRLHKFQVLGSTDGTAFTPLLSGTLASRDEPQAFVLPAPADVRVVKLVPIDAQDPKATSCALAEFEAIADPASSPLGSIGLDIAPILRGGHVVTMDPYVNTQAMLDDASQSSVTASWAGSRKEPLSWVVAFLDDRAARIDRLDWRYGPNQDASSAVPSVDVFGSVASPNGPWTKLGTWTIAPHGDSTPFRPADQPLARYLRFVAAPAKSGYNANLPLRLSVHEPVAGAAYHSVLALPDEPAPPAAASAPQGRSASPTALAFDAPVHGVVRAGTTGDHWMLTVPAGARGVTLALANAPSVSASLTVKNAGGTAVALKEDRTAPDVHRYTGVLPAGQYDVTVVEPPHSIAVVWDTSASVSDWLPAIVAAVRSFTRNAAPGRDEMALLPLHDPVAKPLVSKYSGDPAALFASIQRYDWKDSSSAAEGGLVGAMQTLQDRPGRHAIVLLTDAETSSLDLTPQVWSLMARTTPQIFTLSVPTNSTGPAAWRSRNLMVDWAASTGGFNASVGDASETEAAFARVASALRSWAPYTLTASAATTPPAPGLLTVTRAAKATTPAARPSVALLLDASGSMLQAIKGRRKIDIARAELDRLVRTVIADATPVTLRVYGQGGSGSCSSDLMMPLAPLDRAKAEAIVAKVRSTNGAKTATAASLHATAADLAGAQGAKRVILITDGEENCGGNVEAEIAALRKSGIDVELDVVGFAIDSPASAKTFKTWAGLGGGRYYEAKDAATLDTAMRAAVTEHFDVVDAAGAVVTSGDVGGKAVSLAAGHYSVTLHGNPAVSIDVDVPPGGSASAVLP